MLFRSARKACQLASAKPRSRRTFGNDTALSKYEPDLGVLPRKANVERKRHSDPYPHRMAVDGANGWFPNAERRQGDLAPGVAVLVHVARLDVMPVGTRRVRAEVTLGEIRSVRLVSDSY